MLHTRVQMNSGLHRNVVEGEEGRVGVELRQLRGHGPVLQHADAVQPAALQQEGIAQCGPQTAVLRGEVQFLRVLARVQLPQLGAALLKLLPRDELFCVHLRKREMPRCNCVIIWTCV